MVVGKRLRYRARRRRTTPCRASTAVRSPPRWSCCCPCLAVPPRRDQRKLCPLHQSHRTTSNEIAIRKKTDSSDIASPLAHAAVRSRQLSGVSWNLRCFASTDGPVAALSLSATGKSMPTSLLLPERSDWSPASIPLRARPVCRSDVVKCRSRDTGIGAMSAGNHNFHIQRPGPAA